MIDIEVEHKDAIMILKITGIMEDVDIQEMTRMYMPQATCHVLFDMTNATMGDSINYQKLCELPANAKGKNTYRDPKGKSAHVSPNTATYGMLNMLTTILESSKLTHKQKAFKSLEEALKWLSE